MKQNSFSEDVAVKEARIRSEIVWEKFGKSFDKRAAMQFLTRVRTMPNTIKMQTGGDADRVTQTLCIWVSCRRAEGIVRIIF